LGNTGLEYRYAGYRSISNFIQSIDLNFNITKELTALSPIKCTTKSCNNFNALKSTLSRLDIKLNYIFGIITDGDL